MDAPNFYDPNLSEEGNLSLTTSFQTVETGQSGSASDIVVLSATNESVNASTITLADNAGNTIGVMTLPASAGQAEANPPIDLLRPGYGMAGLEWKAGQGYIYHLAGGKVLQAKVNSVTGGARRLFWKSKTF